MSVTKYLAVVFLAIALASCSLPKSGVDLVLTNGKFDTIDPRLPEAQAVAVDGSRIVAVGTDSAIASRYIGRVTINLKKSFVLPGLIDGHCHMTDLGVMLTTLDLTQTRSAGAVAQMVAGAAARLGPGTWIRGRGWDQDLWSDREFPSHEILDRAAPDNFVYLFRVDGHAIWVNKKVLQLANITRDTKDPEGGRIVRDSEGNPTGVLLDAARDLVAEVIPPPTDSEVEGAILAAADTCARFGLTEVEDARVFQQTIRVYRKLFDERRLRIRVASMYYGMDSTLPELLKSGPIIDYDGFYTMRAVKIYMDGALGSRGAALVQSYSDDPGNFGLTEMGEKDLENITIAALSNGFQVCTHAIGDRANHVALDAYQKALAVANVSDPRLRIEHAQVLLKDDIPRFRELGVIPSMQPAHCTSDMYWAEARLGPERIKRAYAWRSLLDDGNIIVGGSDFPAVSPDPRLGIYAAITRQDLNGVPRDFEDAQKYFELSPDAAEDSSDFNGGFFPSQRMTLEEAIKSFTLWAAYGTFQENEKGSISAGKLADFSIFEKDFRTISPRDIPDDEVLATIVGGKLVYVNPSLKSWSAM